MVSRIPGIAAALLVVGLLLAPASTTMFVKATVSAAWHSASTALDAARK
jgi:hypothetical protein